ncbi:MAG TPA: cell division protein FtsZ [Stellaceae bacterium]|nr:cell division protein FtsZ [Stellaceae bacterium]
MSLNLSIPDEEQDLKPRITVVGVGGAGGNAVSNMVRSGLNGCEFIVTNTDAQAMRGSLAERRIQLGVGVTRGLGAGSRPEIGRIAAEEALEEIMHALEGSNMVFITAGMGGGTGTGAAPVIARAAREAGILTLGVVTKPFHFEGSHRMRLAEAGILELQKFVDTLIVIPNQNLFRVANERTTFADAFKMADDVLAAGVRGVTDLMIMPGLINLDFADIRAVMSEMGKAMMGTGEADGDRRSIDAAEAAISNPLLEDVSMKGARGVLINVTGGLDMTLFEVDEAANRIREEVDPEANIIFGSTFDEKLEGRMRISVVATGIDLEGGIREPRPVISLVSDRSRAEGMAKSTPAPRSEPAAAPALTFEHSPAQVPLPAPIAAAVPPPAPAPVLAVEPDPPQVVAAEQAAVDKGGFVPPKPVEAPVRHVVAAAPPPAPPLARPAAPPQQEPAPAAKPKSRMPSLFERVTNAGRMMKRDETPAPQVAPAGPQPPRLGAADPADRITPARRDEDLLDIPAFLRRQAN